MCTYLIGGWLTGEVELPDVGSTFVSLVTDTTLVNLFFQTNGQWESGAWVLQIENYMIDLEIFGIPCRLWWNIKGVVTSIDDTWDVVSIIIMFSDVSIEEEQCWLVPTENCTLMLELVGTKQQFTAPPLHRNLYNFFNSY